MFEIDFCSRLVGWGFNTALMTQHKQNALPAPPTPSHTLPSSQSFQKTSSFVSSPYLLIHLCNLRFCIAFGIVLCREVSTKWPWSKSSAFFIYLPHLPQTLYFLPIFPSEQDLKIISWFKTHILRYSPMLLYSAKTKHRCMAGIFQFRTQVCFSRKRK